MAWHPPPILEYRFPATNATRSYATSVTGVTSSKPIMKYASVRDATDSFVASAMKWINATPVKRWYAQVVPLFLVVNFAVPACAKNALLAAGAAALYSANEI